MPFCDALFVQPLVTVWHVCALLNGACCLPDLLVPFPSGEGPGSQVNEGLRESSDSVAGVYPSLRTFPGWRLGSFPFFFTGKELCPGGLFPLGLWRLLPLGHPRAKGGWLDGPRRFPGPFGLARPRSQARFLPRGEKGWKTPPGGCGRAPQKGGPNQAG